jgi:predicted GNAT family acetyltransferase
MNSGFTAGAGPAQAITVVHNQAESRFEAVVQGLLCVCEYRMHDGTVAFTHTEVPGALSGRGIAAALVAAALAWARGAGLKVRPLCSYVALFMRRHPQTQDLLAR